MPPLAASAFNCLDQYTSNPSNRPYNYAELAVFFPSGNNHQYSKRLPTESWPG